MIIKAYGTARAIKKIKNSKKYIDKAINKAIKTSIKKQTLWCKYLLSLQSVWYNILKGR